jgi:hypothetical protein
MKITSVKAEERFDNTEFSSEVVDGMARGGVGRRW